MTQDTELERCARIVVKARSLFRLNSILYYSVLNAAIDDLEGAVMQAELARQDAIPLPDMELFVRSYEGAGE